MTFGGAPYPPLLGLYIRHHFGPRECTNPRHNMGLEVVREKFLICIWKTYFPKVGHAFLSFPLFWLRKRKLTSRILWSDVFRVSVLDLENICNYDGRRCRHTLVIIIYGVSGYVVTLVEKAFRVYRLFGLLRRDFFAGRPKITFPNPIQLFSKGQLSKTVWKVD